MMAKNKASFSGLGNTAKSGRSVIEAHIARIALSDNCTLCVRVRLYFILRNPAIGYIVSRYRLVVRASFYFTLHYVFDYA